MFVLLQSVNLFSFFLYKTTSKTWIFKCKLKICSWYKKFSLELEQTLFLILHYSLPCTFGVNNTCIISSIKLPKNTVQWLLGSEYHLFCENLIWSFLGGKKFGKIIITRKTKILQTIFTTFKYSGVGCSEAIEEAAGRVKSTTHVQLVNYFKIEI